MQRYRKLLGQVLFVVLISCCISVYAALLICGACGYENPAKSRFCNHCGGVLSGGAEEFESAAQETEPEAAESGEEDGVTAELVEAELKEADARLKKGKAWQALMFCENAMALNQLTGEGEGNSKKLLRMHAKCEKGLTAMNRKCPVCSGSGRVDRQMDSLSTRGESRTQSMPSVQCTSCRGSGRISGQAGLNQMRYHHGRAEREYTLLRQTRNWVPVGNAWIPGSLDGKLNYRQIAMIKRATGSRCSECLGRGRATCVECRGTGRRKCPVNDCVDGYVQKTVDRGLSTGKARNSDERGMVLRSKCEVCGGKSWAGCKSCGRRGNILCEKCDGNGERERCDSCDASGLKSCKRCGGSGEYRKKDCTGCRGGGSVLCSSCKGDGRDR